MNPGDLIPGDTIVLGPPIALKSLINARGRIFSIDGNWIEVEVEPGDRERIARGTCLELGSCITVNTTCVEKVSCALSQGGAI